MLLDPEEAAAFLRFSFKICRDDKYEKIILIIAATSVLNTVSGATPIEFATVTALKLSSS